jgi:hypothetical protein
MCITNVTIIKNFVKNIQPEITVNYGCTISDKKEFENIVKEIHRFLMKNSKTFSL